MKLEKYNQRLLAILGTIAIIFLMVALVSFISASIDDYRWRQLDEDTGILSEEKIEKLQKENKREQVISYHNPRLVDTLNSVYIIPVSQTNLEEQEDIGTLGLLSKDGSPENSDRRYSSQYYGSFNNLIIYSPKEGTSKKLFDKRVNFKRIKTEYFEDDILILMSASEKDTYRDGVINLLDFKNLYIYSLKQKELKKVSLDGMDVDSYKFMNNEKNLSILFGVDKNKDGKYTDYNEPAIIKKYDFNSGRLIDIVSEEINSELQKTLEGTKE